MSRKTRKQRSRRNRCRDCMNPVPCKRGLNVYLALFGAAHPKLVVILKIVNRHSKELLSP